MKLTFVLLVSCVVYASASFMSHEVKYADKDFLKKQKWIFEILEHVYQNDMKCEYYDVSKNFDLTKHFADFEGHSVGLDFWTMYNKDFIKYDDIFAVAVDYHREMMVALFNVFYYAKDWDTFYKVATWARFHINPDMFIYAFTAAILHRHDCVGMILPAMYEINPFHFYPSDMIQKAQSTKMRNFHGVEKVDNVYTVHLTSKYNKWLETYGGDSQLSYFTEDVGLNAYYFYFQMDYPFWLGGEDFGLYKDRRGEYYLYQHQQFLARYFMERLSNGMGEIPELDFDSYTGDGYFPRLRYFNGISFPYRPENYISYEHSAVDMVNLYETRVKNAIDRGYIFTTNGTKIDLKDPEAIEYLGNLMQANEDSVNPRLYGFWELQAKNIITPNFWFEDNDVIPGVLDHYESSMRDPIFYEFYKRFLNSYWMFKDHLESYTKDDLEFEGVSIENVFVDKLITYMDYFDADISNVVDYEFIDNKAHHHRRRRDTQEHLTGEDFVIYGKTHRLNHAEFTAKMTIKSDAAQKAVVKMFIGPKTDVDGHVYHLEETQKNWYELDHFVVDLAAGENVISRKSTDFSWFVNDRTTYFDLYKKVLLALDDKEKFPLDMSEAHCGFPRRLMLPRGTKGGMPFQMFFFVYPYHAPKVEHFKGFDATLSCGVGSGARNIDTLPFGYPFDRVIDKYVWPLPNMKFYDTMIYFKEDDKEVHAH